MSKRTGFPVQIAPQSNLPVYAQIRQQITWLIASGTLDAGSRLPNVRDLAAQLKINLHTVRQAYHALQADGLLETTPGRGTRVLPIELSQPLPRTDTPLSHTIGVLFPGIVSFYAPLLLGLEETASNLGYLLLTGFTHDSVNNERRLAQQLVSRNIDGLIIVSPLGQDYDRPYYAQVPAVFVDAPQFRANSVNFNFSGAGYEATRHLISHGHTRIGFITASLAHRSNASIARGYRRAHTEARLVVDDTLTAEAAMFLREFGYAACQRLLSLPHRPTAIVAASDVLAIGAVQALREAGIGIPRSMALASIANVDFADLIDPPLTTVALPAFEAGKEAAQRLHGLLGGAPARPAKLIRGERLIIRGSCGCRTQH